ncbi:ABC transporter permease subunit [Suttonella sp. R2A3]|uniref:ABC transporter permease n=1 Tax=Suttonella sp. R2A3 TaxID=2908648 RepID=UPI001F3ABB8F|nr:ABC transporter permease subunit [Suttonella sp. R2A3]UJF25165.1 ABC transporter permease subunit [Suttonella sp. R2A3]
MSEQIHSTGDITQAPKGESLWHNAWQRLRSNKAALTSIFVLLGISAMAIFGPMLRPFAFDQIFWDYYQMPPSWENGHWFGTEGNGRDLFVRTMYGIRISLLVGLAATSVSLLIGVTYGAVAGYVGGRVDNLMMRFVDVMYSMPFMFFVILLMAFFGRNIVLMFAAIGAIEWLTMARIVRGQTLSLRHKEFVIAAQAMGVSSGSIIRRHIIPNTLGTVIVYVTLTIPVVILTESFLSFLGLGVQEPMTSLGVLISEGANQMESTPWTLLFPAIFLALILLCFNFIGDGLRDALDPKDR